MAIDLFSDGVMIGAGSTLNPSLGLLLALGQVPADIPEGFASTATFRRIGVSRKKRMLLAASFAVPIFVGATIGYWAVRGQAAIIQVSLLSVTAGILTALVIEEIMTQAHEGEEPMFAGLFLIGGFTLFALLSVFFE